MAAFGDREPYEQFHVDLRTSGVPTRLSRQMAEACGDGCLTTQESDREILSFLSAPLAIVGSIYGANERAPGPVKRTYIDADGEWCQEIFETNANDNDVLSEAEASAADEQEQVTYDPLEDPFQSNP